MFYVLNCLWATLFPLLYFRLFLLKILAFGFMLSLSCFYTCTLTIKKKKNLVLPSDAVKIDYHYRSQYCCS